MFDLWTSKVLKDVEMFVGGETFTDASGEVSIGFTNRHFATCIHEHLSSDKHSHIYSLHMKTYKWLAIVNLWG